MRPPPISVTGTATSSHGWHLQARTLRRSLPLRQSSYGHNAMGHSSYHHAQIQISCNCRPQCALVAYVKASVPLQCHSSLLTHLPTLNPRSSGMVRVPHSLAPPPPSTDSLRVRTHASSSLLTTTAATGHGAEYGFNPMPTFGPSARSSLDLPLAARLGYSDAGTGREVSRSHAFTTTSVSFGVPQEEGTAVGTAEGGGGCVLGGCLVK